MLGRPLFLPIISNLRHSLTVNDEHTLQSPIPPPFTMAVSQRGTGTGIRATTAGPVGSVDLRPLTVMDTLDARLSVAPTLAPRLNLNFAPDSTSNPAPRTQFHIPKTAAPAWEENRGSPRDVPLVESAKSRWASATAGRLVSILMAKVSAIGKIPSVPAASKAA